MASSELKNKAQGSEGCRKRVFRRPKCVGVCMWAVLEIKTIQKLY